MNLLKWRQRRLTIRKLINIVSPELPDFILVAEALSIHEERVVVASADAQRPPANRTGCTAPFHLRRENTA